MTTKHKKKNSISASKYFADYTIQIGHSIYKFITEHTILFAFVNVLAGMIVTNMFSLFIEGRLNNLGWALALVFIGFAVIAAMIQKNMAEITNLNTKMGITVQYLNEEVIGHGQLFHEAKKIIEKAEKNIYVVNSPLIEMNYLSGYNDSIRESEDSFYAAILAKVRNGLIYRRIIQVQHNKSMREIVIESGYLKHFREMLEIQNDNSGKYKISLHSSPARQMTTFALVDEVYLIWQVSKILDFGQLQMIGAFVIHDPQQELTIHFKNFFELLQNNASAISLDELTEL